MAKKGIGRPTKMTKETVDKLEYAFSIGCSDLEACVYADICKQTLYTYQSSNKDFLDRKELLKENPALKAREMVYSNITADIDTAKWYLERKKKSEFSPQANVKLTGDANEPVQVVYIDPDDKKAMEQNIDQVIDGD